MQQPSSLTILATAMSYPFTITIPSPEEYPQLVALWEASVRATHHFLTEEDIRFYKPLMLTEYLNAVHLYCIRNEAGVPEGFMGVLYGKLEMLFVHPNVRGKGIGKALLHYALDELEVTMVDVNEQNTQAVGFYLRMGFTVGSRSEVDGMGKPYPVLHMYLVKE